MSATPRALVALLAGALCAPLLAAPAVADGEATPPAPQDVSTFCTNPTAAPFTDVQASEPFALAIRCLATAEIVSGGPEDLPAEQYGPTLEVSRAQMASFIANLLRAADARDRNRSAAGFASQVQHLPEYDGENRFTDVPDDLVHVEEINRLAAAGIVTGGASGAPATTYSPSEPVSRAQMATFLNRAVAFAFGQDPADAGAGAGYSAPEGVDYYTDDAGTFHEASINGVTSVGIAVGDGADSFDPMSPVSRAQMAGFVSRTLAQLYDDDRIHSLQELYTGHFAPASRADETRTVSSAEGEVTFELDVREYAAGFLGEDQYRLTLFRAENVVRGPGDLVVFAAADGVADQGELSSRIVAVGDSEEQAPPEGGPTTSVAVVPGENGTVQIDVANEGEPEDVVAVLHLDGGEGEDLADGGSEAGLEVDGTGRPLEPFGVSGATAFVEGSDVPMSVMTRNVYLGADITRPLRAQAEPGQDPRFALANANHAMWEVVVQTDFPARAELLAQEVVQQKPDVIGLQEVATWRSGPLEASPATDEEGRVIPNAEWVEYDFLQTLLAELREVGELYDVVNVQVESDVEAGSFKGDDPFAEDAQARDRRLTMHDVLLKRAGAPIVVQQAGGVNYDAVLPFEIGGYKYEFVRGYNWADVLVGTQPVRLLNTHLESQYSSFAMAQARELVAEQVEPATRPVVLTCDCNSDPLDTSTKEDDPIDPEMEHREPYQYLTSVLHDTWITAGRTQEDPAGFTSGLNETVDEPAPASFTHRIDLVLTRDVDGSALPASDPRTVGHDPANRTASGLWPSDHAGYVVRVQP